VSSDSSVVVPRFVKIRKVIQKIETKTRRQQSDPIHLHLSPRKEKCVTEKRLHRTNYARKLLLYMQPQGSISCSQGSLFSTQVKTKTIHKLAPSFLRGLIMG